MKTWFVLLSTFLCCCAAIADDAVLELSEHLGTTPALVVVVCGVDEGDLPTIAGLVEQTPWTIPFFGQVTRRTCVAWQSVSMDLWSSTMTAPKASPWTAGRCGPLSCPRPRCGGV